MATSAQIAIKAREFIKTHKPQLCQKFASLEEYPPVEKPSAYFMAGSPGAGKTEFSKSFIKELSEKEPTRRIVRIDADEIRDFIPFYDKTNAYRIQGAAALGVEKLLDCTLQNNQDFILDATFADLEKSRTNILRCLHKKRKIAVVYLYQDPVVAWQFTKKREKLEGRKIPLDMFINAFFAAKENVNKIKKEFKNYKEVELWLIIKNLEQGIEKTYFNIDNVDSYLKIDYTAESLKEKLRK
ncbi:zeta toxin family protein [Candidatus Daviesbacteria bacterium]|nr:zeta toxin family protein [Candidatus Daviesbacteria bacterium]